MKRIIPRILISISILVLVSAGFSASSDSETSDHFIELAERGIQASLPELVEPQPPVLPEKYLTKDKKPEVNFEPLKKMDTKEELDKMLAEFNKKYEPFLKDHSPEIEKKRYKIFLEDFKWRKETEEDRKDFYGFTLKGKGEWTRIKIPHYGPPQGRTVTYYFKEFETGEELLNRETVFIGFEGINYEAEVFINGQNLGSHEGYFGPFEFECKDVLKEGKNILLVKVENDYSWHSFIDKKEGNKLFSYNSIYAVRKAPDFKWEKAPAGWLLDSTGMGIWQDVYLEGRSEVFIDDIFVRTMGKDGKCQARIELFNTEVSERNIKLSLSVFGQNFKENVIEELIYDPGKELKSKREITIESGKNYLTIPFKVKEPKLWEPESPWLYKLQVKLINENEKIIDTTESQFGIRTFEMKTDKRPKGRLYLNGQKIKLRGTNTHGNFSQCATKKDYDQLIEDILLAKICNINYVRLTGRVLQSEVYEYFDKLGLMCQSDLPLCSALLKSKYIEALKQAEETERLIRNHPSCVMVSYINEPLPDGQLKPHRYLMRDELLRFFENADTVISQQNPDRVTKKAEGDYSPPAQGLPDEHCYCLWYNGHGVPFGKLHKGYFCKVKKGWNYSCGEFGIEGLDSIDYMMENYPQCWLPESADDKWSPSVIKYAQTEKMNLFWFEDQETMKEWVEASQNYQAEGIRLMTEAFRRDNNLESFCVHLFVDAYPGGWLKAIMDHGRNPKPAYFTYKQALQPILVSLRTDRFDYFEDEEIKVEAWVCNDLNKKPEDAELRYHVTNGDKVIASGTEEIDVGVANSQFEGFIKFNAPACDERRELKVYCALIENNDVISNNKIVLEVFPKTEIIQDKTVFLVGDNKGEATEILKELGIQFDAGMNNLNESGLIVVSDMGKYRKHENRIAEYVKKGAELVFLSFPSGNYNFEFGEVTCYHPSTQPINFVSRKTGHKIIENFKADDFKFWYDEEKGQISGFLKTTFDAEGFRPFLNSVTKKDGSYEKSMAAGEKDFNSGKVRINLLELANRIKTNPTARAYAIKLLGF